MSQQFKPLIDALSDALKAEFNREMQDALDDDSETGGNTDE